jgi:acetoacetyl-CoA reductase
MAAGGRQFRANDVAADESCVRYVAQIQTEVGPVDILINNACIARGATSRNLDKVNLEAVARTNLDSVFNMSKSVCDGMVERGWSRTINISSIIGGMGDTSQTNDAVAKAGMHSLPKSLALGVARKGVTINTVSPGLIGKKMVSAVPEKIRETKITPQIPVGWLGEHDEIAALFVFVCARARPVS